MREAYPNDHQPCVSFPMYSRGNYGEAFPNPLTPMTGSLIQDATNRGQRRFAVKCGMLSSRHLRDLSIAVSGQFWGYEYGNVSIARLAAVRAPGVKVSDIDEQFVGVGVLPPYVPRRGDRDVRASIRLLRFANRAFKDIDAKAAADVQREVDEWRASLCPPQDATIEQLLERVRSLSRWCEKLIVHMMTVSLHAATARVIIERLVGSEDVAAANAMTSGLGNIVSAQSSMVLWELAREVADTRSLAAHFDTGLSNLDARLRADPDAAGFVERFDRFLAEHGFHGIDEIEVGAPKWKTDVEVPLAIIERLRYSPVERDPQQANERLANERLSAIENARRSIGWPKRVLLERAIRAAAVYAPAREATKAALVKTVYEARVGLVELARRAEVHRDDIFLVTEPELETFLSRPENHASTIANRRALRLYLAERIPPFWFSGEVPEPSTWELRATPLDIAIGGTTLRGLGVSAGRVTGTARVILDPYDPSDLEPGDILVAPETDPAWTPLFLAVAGVVVNVGAQTSHAATIARELGIPAIVGVTDATRRIRTGTHLTIDGTIGTIEIGAM